MWPANVAANRRQEPRSDASVRITGEAPDGSGIFSTCRENKLYFCCSKEKAAYFTTTEGEKVSASHPHEVKSLSDGAEGETCASCCLNVSRFHSGQTGGGVNTHLSSAPPSFETGATGLCYLLLRWREKYLKRL